ncbi:MAG: outer membrane lipoprotein-sorting protein [Halioglobus sp.]
MKSLLGFLALYLAAGYAIATDNPTKADRGREVVKSFTTSDDGFESSIAIMHMSIRDRRGAEITRRLELRTLEGHEPEGDRSVIIFLAPGDIAGTALLSHSRIEREDQQWLFLPSLSRVKRISSANKSGPFVGSEFSYEDLAGQELQKFTYEWLREELYDGRISDVVRRTPRYKRSGYAFQLLWIDRDAHQIRQIHYYNRSEQHSKTLVMSAFEHHKSKFYRPHELLMANHLTGRETRLVVEELTLEASLTARDFNHVDFAEQ